ncbi:MAG TPA: quinone-dependent dihydroorotate dehydrogenase [Micromonosporaceae bacterium]
MWFERTVRPMLFRVGGADAEQAHEWTLRRLAALSRQRLALAALRRMFAVDQPREVFGLRFANPVGLAAGMDKDGVALPAWPSLGFGFVEVGTVTWHAQPGNDRPRMFRLRRSEAVINRMGFNNAGARALADRLRASGPMGVPLGVSLGKSRRTGLADAVEDYLASLRVLYPYGDYFAINVSSPNTPGLRQLQDRAQLAELLAALRAEATRLAGAAAAKPLLVKIAPDLTEPAIADLLAVCLEYRVAGVIATNTTLARTGLAPADVARAEFAGGLSGRPLTARAREVVAFVHRETGGRLPIIGVGGITGPADALRLADAGASLVQLYTGFVYHGPALVRSTARALSGGAWAASGEGVRS